MSLTVYTEPFTYSAGYSDVPLRYASTNYNENYGFNYLINLGYNKESVTTMALYIWNEYTYTKCTCTNAHNYKTGDIILLDDSDNSDYYTGYYTIMEVPSSATFVINLTLRAPKGGNNLTSYNVIKYKMPADLDGEVKLNFQNTLKDYVTEQTDFNNDIISGTSTGFKYDIIMGEEYEYVLEFTDNQFVTGGNVGFLTTGSQSDINLSIGDTIDVQQDPVQWTYTDNFFSEGNVGFTSSNSHNFRIGQEITVTGQVTEDYYNGISTIKEIGTNWLVTNKSFTTSTPVEGGVITGVPKPEYNATCQVIGLTESSGYGVVITNNLYTDATSTIGGDIYLQNRYIRDINNTIVEDKWVYNARIEDKNWTEAVFDDYVVTSGATANNYLSTIYTVGETHKIEKNAKGWLLVHNDASSYSPHYRFFSATGSELCHMRIANTSGNTDNYYLPYGLNQINSASNQYVLSGATLSTIIDDVYEYYVSAGTTTTINTQEYSFRFNDDCSRFEMYNLMWKDALGSWLVFPFNYMSKDGTEVDKSTYYKSENNWNTSDNTYTKNSWDRGEDDYYTRSRDTVILNSGFISEVENELIKDLLKSTKVYLQDPNGNIFSAKIDDKKIQFGKNINDGVWQYMLNVRYASNDYRF